MEERGREILLLTRRADDGGGGSARCKRDETEGAQSRVTIDGKKSELMKSQYGDVAVETRGHVAVLTFSRPPNNHVSVESMRDLADALVDIDAETNLRVSVLTAGGKVFCAGADLVNPGGVGAEGMQGINPLYVEAVRLFSAKKPIIAAVQGAAVGAGLGLALVADFRVVAPEARFTANFVKLGFHPGFGITYTLPRLVGRAAGGAALHDRPAHQRRDRRVDWGLATCWRRSSGCWTLRSSWRTRSPRTRRWRCSPPAPPSAPASPKR